MHEHRLNLPTRETIIHNGSKAYVIRCKCGWHAIRPTFDECAREFGAHKRAASS